MAKITQVLQTPTFKKAVKKLHKNQKEDLDEAIKQLMADPLLGEQNEDGTVTLELMALGSHENFYRDLKKIF